MYLETYADVYVGGSTRVSNLTLINYLIFAPVDIHPGVSSAPGIQKKKREMKMKGSKWVDEEQQEKTSSCHLFHHHH